MMRHFVAAVLIAAAALAACGSSGSTRQVNVDQSTTTASTIKPSDRYLTLVSELRQRLNENSVENNTQQILGGLFMDHDLRSPDFDWVKVNAAFQHEANAYKDFASGMLAATWPDRVSSQVISLATAAIEYAQLLGSRMVVPGVQMSQKIADARARVFSSAAVVRGLLGLPFDSFL